MNISNSDYNFVLTTEPHKPDFFKMSVKVRVKIKRTAAKRVEKEGVAFCLFVCNSAAAHMSVATYFVFGK